MNFCTLRHTVVVQDMIDRIADGGEVVIPVASVRPTLEIVLAMYQSAKYNKIICSPFEDDTAPAILIIQVKPVVYGWLCLCAEPK